MFDVVDPHRRIPAHFTLKSPFTADQGQIAKLEDKLENFCQNHTGGTITLDGFGDFHKSVVYVNGTADNKAQVTLDELTATLIKIGWLHLDNHDRNLHLHVTLARPKTDGQYKKIHSYLESNYTPDITISFDSVALLQLDKTNDQWIHHDEFKL